MKRERIEDLGAIRILIMEALDMDIFEDYKIMNLEYIQNEHIEKRKLYCDLEDLKIKLEQIQDYANGFEDGN